MGIYHGFQVNASKSRCRMGATQQLGIGKRTGERSHMGTTRQLGIGKRTGARGHMGTTRQLGIGKRMHWCAWS